MTDTEYAPPYEEGEMARHAREAAREVLPYWAAEGDGAWIYGVLSSPQPSCVFSALCLRSISRIRVRDPHLQTALSERNEFARQAAWSYARGRVAENTGEHPKVIREWYEAAISCANLSREAAGRTRAKVAVTLPVSKHRPSGLLRKGTSRA